MDRLFAPLNRLSWFLFFLTTLFYGSYAQPATVPFHDCFSGNHDVKLNVSTVYAQLLQNDSLGKYLNVTVLGESPQNISGRADGSNNLATLFTDTEMLTFAVFDNSSYLCSTIQPPSPVYDQVNPYDRYCPLPAGPFALATTVTLNRQSYELVTLDTRIKAVDPFSNEILCVDVYVTPLSPGVMGYVYGHAIVVFWFTVALTIAYWVVVGLARIVSAWGRGASRMGPGLWSRAESLGFILASAISGERLAKSPALMRFGTPSMRDIIFHTQWSAALAMVAVQWPSFVYPLLSQTAWSMLSYNMTLTQGGANDDSLLWNPLSVPPFNPPSNFADQLSDPNSVLYIDTSVSNTIFSLPPGASNGIESFAYTVGLRPRDLFGICLALFLAIIAATIVLSLLVWFIDWLASLLSGTITLGRPPSRLGLATGTRSPRYSAGSKDLLDGVGTTGSPAEEDKSLNGHFILRAATKIPMAGKSWWKLRPGPNSFHWSVLHGNLVRILILFHLPITIFSCYQMTLGRGHASLASIVLAALSFAVFSVIIPFFLVIRLTLTSTNKLYDETRTLLSFGPLYNHYRHGSQLFACLLFATNLVFGVTIGCGQKSGTAQAIIILVVELGTALATSLWLPWGQGASMGLISFLFCVARIVIAVLLVILTPTVSIGEPAGAWVSYAILFILGLIYLAYLLMLIVKLIEAAVRIFGGVGFDRSRHVVDSGLFGACGLLGCCGSRRGGHRSRRRTHYRAAEIPQQQPEFALSRPQKLATPSQSHSAPPSVLRPEQALRPYREDSDDESGFIMGSWQPFPRPGYSPVDNQAPSLPETSTNKSGFTRVGGGRAHYDNPYDIASGSTVSFPSVDRRAGSSHTLGTPRLRPEDDDSPPPTPSIASQPRQAVALPPVSNLPPGAMPPAHVRTKSQTAIIEDASSYFNPSASSAPMLGSLSAAVENSRLQPEPQRATHEQEQTVDDDWTSEMIQPKKKHWFNLRKPRRYSEGNPLQLDESAPDEQPQASGKSFVVIRDRKPAGRASEEPRSRRSESGIPSSDDAERPKSFVVLRGNNNSSGEPSGSGQS
ncbi:hypothetical protein GLOTRDRAFT_135976 [Gloeophyllum trabeum ATCC 11539]|uniref:TRP C-terminal domain-containing protein n=1 Tax=Gloeophyllum trabeum (strain ATCC 11539 / FP-39264 / Madison 617) TaxID=670483 RepID=S7QGS9_GLOTA|nr:uncharacterized protein GLOTRDRAFT_135976 [Gloeophyllum trabeum ATCC 11539]EPQ58976.1 hypothetical protein GLOTRDRAFT_135976 [Gloeophyllum trabeum ATCC 11539]